MEFREILNKLNGYLKQYTPIIGVVVIILVATLVVMTYMNFDKQNQIIEKGGFIDGKIKCVCSQEAWDQFEMVDEKIDYDNLIEWVIIITKRKMV